MRSSTKASLNGTATVSPDAARRVFYNRCEPAAQDRAIALLCPQPLRASMGVITTSARRLGALSKHYIECLDDTALPLASQRAMQSNMPFDSVHTIDSDHSPFLSTPTALADVIERIAARADRK